MLRRSASIKLFDLFGFRIGVDASWFLVLFLMIFLLSRPFRLTLHSSDGVAYLTTVVSVLLLFGVADRPRAWSRPGGRRQGIEVKQIDLFLFGGLTQMSRDAATPGEDFKIAAAGPLATFGGDPSLPRRRPGDRRRAPPGPRDPAGLRHPDHARAAVAQLAAADERAAAGVQPGAGVPARRRPDRALDRLAADRRQAPRHAGRRPAWARGSH